MRRGYLPTLAVAAALAAFPAATSAKDAYLSQREAYAALRYVVKDDLGSYFSEPGTLDYRVARYSRIDQQAVRFRVHIVGDHIDARLTLKVTETPGHDYLMEASDLHSSPR